MRKRLSVLWLLLVGSAATTIGGHDAVVGTEINVRLWGTLVLGAGLVIMAGALGFRRGSPQGRALAAVGALLGVVVGGIVLLAQVVNDEPDLRLVYWVTIIVLSLGAYVTVHGSTPEDERSQKLWSQLPILKSVVSLGVLVTLGQFWYSSIYVPTTAPASLTVEPAIAGVAAADGGRLAVRGSLSIRNTSGTRVNTLGSILTVAGEKMEDEEFEPAEFGEQIRSAYRNEIVEATRYAASSDFEIVAHGRLIEDGVYLEPNETLTVPFTAWVPRDRFNVVRVYASLAVARGKVLALETSEPKLTTDREGVLSLAPVPEAGWLRQLTRGDRYVRVLYGSDPEEPTFDVWFAPDRGVEPPVGFDRRMKRFYGFSVSSARAELVLPAEQDPKQRVRAAR